MATERKRFYKEGDVLKCEYGLWHEDTQTMPTAHVRDATPEEIDAYNTEHREAAVKPAKPAKEVKHVPQEGEFASFDPSEPEDKPKHKEPSHPAKHK